MVLAGLSSVSTLFTCSSSLNEIVPLLVTLKYVIRINTTHIYIFVVNDIFYTMSFSKNNIICGLQKHRRNQHTTLQLDRKSLGIETNANRNPSRRYRHTDFIILYGIS